MIPSFKYITEISSVKLNENNKEKTKNIKKIAYVILYDKENKELYRMNDGYLDIGLVDTMEDLFVNFVGATVFCTIAYISIKSEGKYHEFIEKFTPNKIN